MNLKNKCYIHVKGSPDFQIKGNIKDFYDICNEIEKRVGLKGSQISYKYLDFSFNIMTYANLTDYGFDYNKRFTYKSGYNVDLFFKYKDIKFSTKFYTCQSIYEVKLELAQKFHTLQQFIILENIQSNACDVSHIQSKDIITIDFVPKYVAYKVLSCSEDIKEEYYCLVNGTKVHELKSTIAAYHNLPKLNIRIFTDDQDFDIKDDTPLDSFGSRTIFYDTQENSLLQNIEVTLSNPYNANLPVLPVYTENIVGDLEDKYSIFTILEKTIFIGRYLIFSNDFDEINEKKTKGKKPNSQIASGQNDEKVKLINIQFSNNIKLDLYDQNTQEKIKSLEIPLFLKGEDLKKIIVKSFIRQNRNFGIAIEGQIVSGKDYISKYIPSFDPKQITKAYIINQDINTYTFTFQNIKDKNDIKNIMAQDMTLYEVKQILFPNEYPENINLYTSETKKVKLSNSSKLSEINIPTNTIIYDFYQRPDETIYKICHKNKIKNFTYSSTKKSRVVDVFMEADLKTQSSKNTPPYYYKACSKSNNQTKLNEFSFNDKLNQLLLPSQEASINIFKVKDKVSYRIYYIPECKIYDFNENKTIFHPKESLINSINSLKKYLKIPEDQKIVLLSDFAQLKNDAFPILCFPKIPNSTYFVNIRSNDKTLIFKHRLSNDQISLFTIKIEINSKDYDTISTIISEKFKVNLHDIKFFYELPNSEEVNLPPVFSADAFPNNAEITFELPQHNQYVHTFREATNQATKQVTIFDVRCVKGGFDQLMLKLQNEFKIFRYSPGFLTLKFENNDIQYFDYFDYLNSDCVIDIFVDDNINNSFTVSVDIQDKTETYHFIKNDKIEILMKLISYEFNINDYKKIIIKNSNGKDMKDNDVIIENSKYSVVFPKISILCNGSLAKKDTVIEIDCIYGYEKIKEIIRNQLNLKDDNFSLFTQRGKWFKEIATNTFRKEDEPILAHRFLTDLHIYLIESKEKKEIEIDVKSHISELTSLLMIRSLLYPKLNFKKSEFSYTSDGKNIVSGGENKNLEKITISEYLRKQKEKEPNTNGNHIYVLEKNDSKLNSKLHTSLKLPLNENDFKEFKQLANDSNSKNDDNNNDDDDIENQELSEDDINSNDNTQQQAEQSKDNSNSGNFQYTFYNHERNESYTIGFGESATVSDAKQKLWGRINVKKFLIELIFGGKKLRENLKLKSLHLTPEEQIEFYVHDYDPKRLQTMIALRTRSHVNIHPPVKDNL